ncbi:MAG: glycosyltransferase family 1 protein [Cyclobacteriaceae bacterium]|jgi:glycosyltransferase involved in cell wall biosynthesis
MRIGFDSKRLFNNFTGLGNYSRTLLRNLGKYFTDHEYYLYSPNLSRTPETTFFLEEKPFYPQTSKSLFKSYWRSYSIVNQLKKDKIQLYHGLSHEIPAGLKRSGIKSLVTIHDLIFKIYPHLYNFLDRKIYDHKIRYSCTQSDRIIAISNNTKSDIINLYGIEPERIEVIYQSCDSIYYETLEIDNTDDVLSRYGIPQEYFIYVGNIERRKNLKLIFDAYQQLPPGRRLPLVLIGRGEKYGKEILGMIKEKGLENTVQWIYDLDDNRELRILYHRSQALLYPSIYEGFGLPVVEALLSKTPVITSNVSSLPEAGGPDTIYIDPHDPEALAEAIIKVSDDSDLRKDMISSGFEYAIQNFNERESTRKLMDCYMNTVMD